MAMRSLAGPWHEPDGPDSFFSNPARKPRHRIQPGWKKRISPNPIHFNQKAVYFTPITDKKDLEWDGYCHPKMYARKRMPRWLHQKYKKAEKQVWRGMSKRMKGEWRFRRLPRDESGKVSGGTLNTHKPSWMLLRPNQYGKKVRPRVGPGR